MNGFNSNSAYGTHDNYDDYNHKKNNNVDSEIKEKENQKRTRQLHIRITPEEDEYIKMKAEKRGINKSDFIKERILDDNVSPIYNRDVEHALIHISNLLIYDVEKHCDDQKFIRDCKKGVKQLWQYLR